MPRTAEARHREYDRMKQRRSQRRIAEDHRAGRHNIESRLDCLHCESEGSLGAFLLTLRQEA